MSPLALKALLCASLFLGYIAIIVILTGRRDELQANLVAATVAIALACLPLLFGGAL